MVLGKVIVSEEITEARRHTKLSCTVREVEGVSGRLRGEW